jgi:hypothetical protein
VGKARFARSSYRGPDRWIGTTVNRSFPMWMQRSPNARVSAVGSQGSGTAGTGARPRLFGLAPGKGIETELR